MKLWVTVTGGALLVAGAVMLVTPGPGLLTIAAGLGVLAKEYHWAKHVLEYVRERIRRQLDKSEGRGGR